MALGAKVSSTSRAAGLIRGTGFLDAAFQVGFPQTKLVACALWDDSVDGHVPIQVSNGGMGLGVFLPKSFIVVASWSIPLVQPVGPTNMGASLESDFDLVASSAVSGLPWTGLTLGKTGVVGDFDVAANVLTVGVVAAKTGFTTTVIREIQIVATVAVTSAGRAAIYVEGLMAPATAQGAS